MMMLLCDGFRVNFRGFRFDDDVVMSVMDLGFTTAKLPYVPRGHALQHPACIFV